MRRSIIIAMCFMLAAATAVAGLANPAEKQASEIMFPNDQPLRTVFEGFESGVPPVGWTFLQTNAVETWFQDSYDPFENLYYATCNYDATYSGPQDEWLYLEYTLETGDDCLSFYALASVYWAVTPYQNYNLFVTIDDVVVWDYYNDNNAAVTWQWQQYVVDLSGYSAGQTITLGLGYQGYDGAQGSFDALQIGQCPDAPAEPCCPSEYICYVVDFNVAGCQWAPLECGVGPIPWEWGVPVGIPALACDDVAVTTVLATGLATDYPVQTGEGAIVGPFNITESCYCMELCHFYDIETGYDGGNVKISLDSGATWQIIYPFDGYDDILDSTSYIAECVGGEEVFTGHMTTFMRDCFDLSDYVGHTVWFGFFFGSDSSVTYPGWYLKWMKLGSDEVTSVQQTTWGSIKSMYK
ncbi:MAG: hypothetical protein ABIG03_03585 [Candidatus Eisenbacteria bacterium]